MYMRPFHGPLGWKSRSRSLTPIGIIAEIAKHWVENPYQSTTDAPRGGLADAAGLSPLLDQPRGGFGSHYVFTVRQACYPRFPILGQLEYLCLAAVYCVCPNDTSESAA